MIAVASGAVIGLLGLALAGGGVWLVALGGSWYYALAGVGLLTTGGLLIARRSRALWVYAAVVAGTLAWALWEVGFDWWQLAPRGAVVVLVGLWLLLPWVTRALVRDGTGRPPAAWRGAGIPLALSVVAAAGVAVAALALDPLDRDGRLPVRTAAAPAPQGNQPAGDWRAYGRTEFGDRYSPLDQITPRNVGRLEAVWTYHTGDVRRPDDPKETTYEVTPLKIRDTLYLCTPHNQVIALNAETGEERWRFDPKVPDETNRQHLTCRGLSYHEAPAAAGQEAGPSGAACPHRLFMPTADARLIALDADTGHPCAGFGDHGTVNLWRNMPHHKDGFYYSTSPPAVTGRLVIVGGAVNDNVSTMEPSGVIRAYDVITGALVWNWDSGKPDQTAPIGPDQTYTTNSPNSWTTFSVDEALGMVYVPIGNQPPDQWGGNRSPETERVSSSVVALDLTTGKMRWVFQTVHHDLWDMDVPAQPSLLDLKTDQGTVPTLVAPTKQGDIYVLDRRTGKPILPVKEEPAPQGAAAGDTAAPTQPTSALTFKPPRPLEGRDMWGATLFDQLACRIEFRRLRYEGRYTPPSTQGTLVYPGNFGVFNWGGVAVDPVRQIVFATPAYLPFVSKLIPRENATTNYVSNGKPGLNENYGAPFAVDLHPFVSPLGLPCTAPPWGYVAGADLTTGTVAWQHRNGTVRDLAPVPLPFRMGVPDLGGPIVTAGGVAFLSGTLDYYVRAYDVTTGAQLWESRLPAGGQATPMTYLAPSGRQMLLVVAGGHGSTGTKAGDAVVAYALPPG
ncbi:glucose/quinate/shikimate family membrane-bound PQQ-dependent dehydrogenase [Azospirillum rugosum]|uniref:Quinoprotein glucose dehydrogenase n=1 Tax=Azospirillum rugosum TaxID=416170 RepID=A0ABS4SSI0_9PROT|nr:glucose/quinate/shikimate family membrane-bound PQQ-dependent dehydrogenase [Azospirillum rugosum]MBP2295058.1 quinoprotein glucose dehydrogenase [Azospirillum rugosum]MDQ0528881.1 quinoprotein glucose dehydrogenase [Azospirillum rugosum]